MEKDQLRAFIFILAMAWRMLSAMFVTKAGHPAKFAIAHLARGSSVHAADRHRRRGGRRKDETKLTCNVDDEKLAEGRGECESVISMISFSLPSSALRAWKLTQSSHRRW